MNDTRRHYSVELIEAVTRNDNKTAIPKLDIARAILPYCLKPIEGGYLLPLNRNYKPIGCAQIGYPIEWADYEDPKYQSLRLHPDDLNLTHLNASGYFFNDLTSPISLWGSSQIDQSTYLFKLWLTFEHLGMRRPEVTERQVTAAAKRLGVPSSRLLGLGVI